MTRTKYRKDPELVPADKYDARQISEWLTYRLFDPILPFGADGRYQWAHENPAAWPMVNLPDGLSINEAKTLMQGRALFEARHLPGKHVQKSHGRKGGEAISHDEADELAQKVKTDGGFTYDVNDAKYRTSGFAVSPYPERSKEVTASELTGDDIHAYAAANKDLLDKTDHNLGGWYDTENGTVWLDVSIVKSDKAEAVKVAKKFNQKAIFDLHSLETVPTGGTGRSGHFPRRWQRRALEPSAVERAVTARGTACPECQANKDPGNVPVHPGCHCDVETKSVDMGVAAEEIDALIQRHAETGVDQVGVIDMPEALQVDPGTTTVFVPEEFRFADLVAWAREQVHDYAEDLADQAVGEAFNMLIYDIAEFAQDVEDEAQAAASGHIVVARALRSIVGPDIASLFIIGRAAVGDRSHRPRPDGTRRVVITRADATPEELASAYRLILEGQE